MRASGSGQMRKKSLPGLRMGMMVCLDWARSAGGLLNSGLVYCERSNVVFAFFLGALEADDSVAFPWVCASSSGCFMYCACSSAVRDGDGTLSLKGSVTASYSGDTAV